MPTNETQENPVLQNWWEIFKCAKELGTVQGYSPNLNIEHTLQL